MFSCPASGFVCKDPILCMCFSQRPYKSCPLPVSGFSFPSEWNSVQAVKMGLLEPSCLFSDQQLCDLSLSKMTLNSIATGCWQFLPRLMATPNCALLRWGTQGSVKTALYPLKLWAVALSCWNQTSPKSNSSSRGKKSFPACWNTDWSEFTVTVNSFSPKNQKNITSSETFLIGASDELKFPYELK